MVSNVKPWPIIPHAPYFCWKFESLNYLKPVSSLQTFMAEDRTVIATVIATCNRVPASLL